MGRLTAERKGLPMMTEGLIATERAERVVQLPISAEQAGADNTQTFHTHIATSATRDYLNRRVAEHKPRMGLFAHAENLVRYKAQEIADILPDGERYIVHTLVEIDEALSLWVQ